VKLLYCCLTVYLLLFSASYYLHSPITASGYTAEGARVSSTSLRHGRVAAAAVATWAEFQQRGV